MDTSPTYSSSLVSVVAEGAAAKYREQYTPGDGEDVDQVSKLSYCTRQPCSRGFNGLIART